jgi:hypothetical protein
MQELETVLGSESEMEMLYLGRRVAIQEPAQQPAQPSVQQQQQQQQGEDGDAPQPGPRHGRRPSHAASAPPGVDQDTSEDDGERLSPADGEEEEPRRRHSTEVCTSVVCIAHCQCFTHSSADRNVGMPA